MSAIAIDYNDSGIQELSFAEANDVNGGFIPAIYAAYYAAQYIGYAYTTTQIATGAGFAVGLGAALFAATD